MIVDQLVQYRCGDGTDSPTWLTYANTVNTCTTVSLKNNKTFAEQLDQRRHENFTIEKAVEATVGVLMSLPGGGDCQKELTACSDLHTTPRCWSYYDHDIMLCCNTVRMEGAYIMGVSAAVGHLPSKNGDKRSRIFDIVWKYRDVNIDTVRSTLEEKLFFSNCSAY